MKTTFTTFKTLAFIIVVFLGFQTSFGQIKNSADVVVTSNDDIEIYGNITPNYMTPYIQFDCYNFGILTNYYDTSLVAEFTLYFYIIEDNSGTEIFSDSINITTNSLDVLFLPNCFEPGTNFGSYTGYYNLTSNLNDPNLLNNRDTIHFAISEYTFANENGGTQTIVPDGSNWGPNEPHSWAFGNFFHVKYGTLDSNYGAESATFSIGNAGDPGVADRIISLFLYKWIEDVDEDGNMDADERTAVAFNFYKINGNEQVNDLINLPLLEFPSGNSGPINLESNQNYVLMAEYEPDDQVNLEFVVSTEIDYSAHVFYSVLQENPRYAPMMGVSDWPENESISSIGFGLDIVPVVRLNLKDITVDTKDILNKGNIIKLFPNPTSGILNIKIDLLESQNDASIKIFDVNGKLMVFQSYKNIKYEKIKFDLTKFVDGVYFLHFATESGVRTERFVVLHR